MLSRNFVFGLTVVSALCLTTADAHAKTSKKYLKSMASFGQMIKMNDNQTSCIAESIYAEVEKSNAKAFAKFANVGINADGVPDDIDGSGQLFLVNKIISAYVGLAVIEKGALNSLGEIVKMNKARKRIIADCPDVFPNADFSVLESKSSSESNN